MEESRLLGKCVRCDREVRTLKGWDDNPDDAMEGTFRGHYGSRNDCSMFKAWICDDCAHMVSPEMVEWLGPDKGQVHRSMSREEYERVCNKYWTPEGEVRDVPLPD